MEILKCMLNRQQRLYKNYKKHGFKPHDKIRVEAFREECNLAIQNAKIDYLTKIGNELADPSTSQKSYWKILNRAMNKCRAPKIPPILLDNKFLVNAKEKACEFIKHFSLQCKPLANSSTLPDLHYLTENKLSTICFTNGDIISLIRGLNKNKSSGSDEISARMLSLCDESIILPLKLIFQNIVRTGVFPDMWKLTNSQKSLETTGFEL